MKYYERLLMLGVFTFGDLKELTGNVKTASALVANYLKKGYIVSIKRNLYSAVNLETKAAVADKFKIGSSITGDAYISHHSALEFHGIAHQLFFEIYVSSSRPFKDFQFDGLIYRYVASKTTEGIITYPTNRGVRVTDLERTVIDCIKNIDKSGGLEEILQCLQVITFLDCHKLQAYLQLYNIQMLYQKTGYILEHFKESLQLTDDFFEFCRGQIRQSKRYLGDKEERSLIYNPTWRLYVPKNLMGLLSQGEEELV
jgi:predicted transcriptional regulator of viral defense system